MKNYIAALTAIVIAVAVLFLSRAIPDQIVSAQIPPAVDVVEPHGGGEDPFIAVDEITPEQRAEIKAAIERNIRRLEAEGRLEPARPEAVPLIWPVRKAAGVPHFDVDAISNYVDQNLAFPNQLRDWNCGTRTYDQSNGYNHAGIDVYLWPFRWKMMDEGSAEIIAAAPGTIIFKSDGNFDRSCGLNGGQWNAVYVRHSDNSVAWYGHMKSGSPTTKAVGETVLAGEKLGTVGSSGNSTGPHLHFELYNANGQLQDPFQGTCNAMNANSWWVTQEPYRVSRLNALMTGSAPVSFGTCPAQETPNAKSVFQPGDPVFVTAFYRDNLIGPGAQFSLIRPDGSVQTSWTQTFNQDYSSSWWWWQQSIPLNAPNGNWKVRAVFQSVTYETPFTVAVPTVTISGRVTTPTLIGLRNAVVSLIDANNNRRTATTSSFGIYSFESVPAGATYTMTVSSRRYRFTPLNQVASGNLNNVDFVGLE